MTDLKLSPTLTDHYRISNVAINGCENVGFGGRVLCCQNTHVDVKLKGVCLAESASFRRGNGSPEREEGWPRT